MTQTTLSVPDNVVLVGGVPEIVDLSALAAQNIHAVQWNGTTGEVEYETVNGVREPNAVITSFSAYQPYVDQWTAIRNAPPPPPNLVAYANAKQWAKSVSGYTATINGQQYTIDTDPLSLSLITGKAARFQQANPPASVLWQINPTTFITIAAADFITLAVGVADYIQASFNTLDTVLAGIAGGTITTTAQIDQAFA